MCILGHISLHSGTHIVLRLSYRRLLRLKCSLRILKLWPNHSKKLTKVSEQLSINNFISNQGKQTKSLFSFWIEKTLLLNAMLFLTFQTVQNKHKGLACQTFLHFFAHKKTMSSQQSISNQQTQDTPKVQKATLIKPLSFHNGEANDLWILHVQGTRNTDLLNTNLISKLDPKLELDPILSPMQKKLTLGWTQEIQMPLVGKDPPKPGSKTLYRKLTVKLSLFVIDQNNVSSTSLQTLYPCKQVRNLLAQSTFQ